jgi:hypothetical protein
MTIMTTVAPGFINLGGTRYAVSELKTWKDDRINGRHCVALTTKDGHFRFIEGVSADDIDRLVSEHLRLDSDR